MCQPEAVEMFRHSVSPHGARQTIMVQKEPYPLKVMTRFTDAPLDTGSRRPVICRELTERTEFVDKAVCHEVNDRISPIQPAALPGHLGEGMQSLEQVHMRVLPTWQRTCGILNKVACRVRKPRLDKSCRFVSQRQSGTTPLAE